jgi:hypothetical protein
MSTARKRFPAALLFALLAMAVIATPAAAATWSTGAGATWNTVPNLGPEGLSEATLAGVSCTSPTYCVAVGTADDAGEELEPPTRVGSFSEVWDGTSWRVVPTADAAAVGAVLASVSCVSPSFCVAVGGTHSVGWPALKSWYSSEGRALVEVWNGSSWSVVPTPAEGQAHSELAGVSCIAASFCVAVGSTDRDAMVEIWNGSGWKLARTPFVARQGSPLFDVSCAGRDSCMAVGEYNANPRPGPPEGEVLAEHWNGHRWSVKSPPVVHLYAPALHGVACPSRTECIAVGPVGTSPGNTSPSPLVERWRSGRWQRVTAGLPRYGSLMDVSCVGTGRCVAVGRLDSGHWLDEHDKTAPLILSWDGSRWARESTPPVPSLKTAYGKPDPLRPFLFGISCPAEGGCVAAGAQGSEGAYSPFVLSTDESFAEPTPALPAPKITTAPGATTTARTARLEFGSSLAGAGFECRLDGEGVAAALSHWGPCTSPQIYSHLSPGQKRFSVRAVVGGERSAAATREWTILKAGAPEPVVLPVVGDHANFHATCPLAEPCHERVVVKAGGKELARGDYSIPAHADRPVEIGLTATGRRLLAHRSELAATLVLENMRTGKRATVAVLLVRR